MDEREQIEELHQKYLSLRENTPWEQRDGEECKAYHKWYDSAYVYFKSFDNLQSDSDFQIFVNAEKDGNCFVLEDVYNTISPSYKVLMHKTKNKSNQDNMVSADKSPMVFISHSSKDIEFVEALVTLLESIGFNNKTLFCSSIEDYWIGISQNIFKTLHELFHKHKLFVIFVQSPRYYESPVSLNEMGAAWVLKTDYCSILTSDMTKEQMRGVVDSQTVYIKVNTPEAKARMNELRKKLTGMFNLATMSDTTWERKRNSFLKVVNTIEYPNVDSSVISLEDEYKKLQIEKLKQEAIEKKQAKIRGNIIESQRQGDCILKIFNAGQAIAKNVSVEWLNPHDEVYVQWEFGAIGDITPQNGRSYHISLCIGCPETMRLRYTWSDDFKEDNVFEEELQL